MAEPIGSYERDLHRVFAERRTPSEDWVHVLNKDIGDALDEYCDDTHFHEVQDPLVLVGSSGCGKSTALANWLEKRRLAQARRMRLSSLNPKEEFLFWHAAGCSRQSTFVGHMLRRLMMEMKKHFEIAREVSESEENLSWDLLRFLELAVAKGGKVLLVIDGIQRLKSESGEVKLNWLPLRFPGNVRVVLTATDLSEFGNDVPVLSASGKVAFAAAPASMLPPPQGVGRTTFNSGNVEWSDEGSVSTGTTASTSVSTDGTASIDDSSAAQSKRKRVINELLRREWRLMEMPRAIAAQSCQDMVNKYTMLTAHADLAAAHAAQGGGSLSLDQPLSLLSAAWGEEEEEHEGGDGVFSLTQEPHQTTHQQRRGGGGGGGGTGTAALAAQVVARGLHNPLSSLDPSPPGGGNPVITPAALLPGLSLFPAQVNRLANGGLTKQAGNPLFLGVLLRSLRWGSLQGYDVGQLLSKWCYAADSFGLYGLVLDQWEKGQPAPSEATKEKKLSEAKEFGGFPALRDHHPLYVLAKESSERLATEASEKAAMLRGDQDDDEDLSEDEEEEGHESTATPPTPGGADAGAGGGSGSLVSAKPSLTTAPGLLPKASKEEVPLFAVGDKVEALYAGGEDWYPGSVSACHVSADAQTFDVDYDDGDREAEVPAAMLRRAGKGGGGGSGGLSEGSSISKKKERGHGDGGGGDDDGDDEDYGDDYNDEDEEEESGGGENKSGTSGSNNQQEEDSSDNDGDKDGEAEKDDDDDDEYGDDDYDEDDDYGDDFDDDEKTTPRTSPSKENAKEVAAASALKAEKMAAEAAAKAKEEKKKAALELEAKRVAEVKKREGKKARAAVRKAAKEAERQELWLQKKAVSLEEVELTMGLVPVSHLGGVAVDGLDSVLGYALALLFVARHGLNEHELFAMLHDLKSEDDLQVKRGGVSAQDEAEEALYTLLAAKKAKLLAIFRDMDVNNDGTISMHEFRRGMRRLDIGINDMQLDKIVKHVMSEMRNPSSNNSNSNSNKSSGEGRQPSSSASSTSASSSSSPARSIESLRDPNKPRPSVAAASAAAAAGGGGGGGGFTAGGGGGGGRSSSASVASTASPVRRSSGYGYGSDNLTHADLFRIFEKRLSDISAAKAPSSQEQAGTANGNLGDTASALEALLNDDDFMMGSSVSGGGPGGANSGGDATLGPELENALLTVLKSLGVMHYPEKAVLVLPQQSEALREVVYYRYVGSSAAKDKWHGRIVKYFERHHPSLRRCEELPWHLQRVRKWTSAMLTISDLKTFEIMFGDPLLKMELLEYWRLLSLGPLFVSDLLEVAHLKMVNATKDALKNGADKVAALLPYDANARLSELDKQAVLGLTDTRARQHKLEGQVATFDVVSEYNKTLEQWAEKHKPSTKRLAHVLYKVGAFLVEFSDVFAKSVLSQEGLLSDSLLPPFVRKPLQYRPLGPTSPGLSEIGIVRYAFQVPSDFLGVNEPLPLYKQVAATSSSSMSVDGLSVGGGGGSVGGGGAPSPLLLTGNLDGGGNGADAVAMGGGGGRGGSSSSALGQTLQAAVVAVMEAEAQDPRSSGGGATSRAVAERAKVYDVAKHYYYDRWVWMQFPWLALANATAASHKARGDALLHEAAAASNMPVTGGPASSAFKKAEAALRSSVSAGAVLTGQKRSGSVSKGGGGGDGGGNGDDGADGGDNNAAEAFMLGETGSVLLRHPQSGEGGGGGSPNSNPMQKALLGSSGTERRVWNVKKVKPPSSSFGGSSSSGSKSNHQSQDGGDGGSYPRPPVCLSQAQKDARVGVALDKTYSMRDIDFSSVKLARLEQAAYAKDFDESGAKTKAMPSRMKPDPILTAWAPSLKDVEKAGQLANSSKSTTTGGCGCGSGGGGCATAAATNNTNGVSGGGGGSGGKFKVGIPYSYSSAKAQRAGTRFPSVEKLHIDKILQKEKNQDKESLAAVERFGGSYTPRTIAGVIELKHLDTLQQEAPSHVDMGFLPAHQSMFAVPLNDMKKSDSLARVAKLRKAYNQILGHRHRKEKLAAELKTSIEERANHDEHLAAVVSVGERTMDALELRLRRMTVELKASDALGLFYQRIVEQCGDTRNPACEKQRLQEMETQAGLGKQQVRDLLLKRQQLYVEAEHISKVKIKKVRQQHHTCSGLRSALKRRMAAVLAETAQLKKDRQALARGGGGGGGGGGPGEGSVVVVGGDTAGAGTSPQSTGVLSQGSTASSVLSPPLGDNSKHPHSPEEPLSPHLPSSPHLLATPPGAGGVKKGGAGASVTVPADGKISRSNVARRSSLALDQSGLLPAPGAQEKAKEAALVALSAAQSSRETEAKVISFTSAGVVSSVGGIRRRSGHNVLGSLGGGDFEEEEDPKEAALGHTDIEVARFAECHGVPGLALLCSVMQLQLTFPSDAAAAAAAAAAASGSGEDGGAQGDADELSRSRDEGVELRPGSRGSRGGDFAHAPHVGQFKSVEEDANVLAVWEASVLHRVRGSAELQQGLLQEKRALEGRVSAVAAECEAKKLELDDLKLGKGLKTAAAAASSSGDAASSNNNGVEQKQQQEQPPQKLKKKKSMPGGNSGGGVGGSAVGGLYGTQGLVREQRRLEEELAKQEMKCSQAKRKLERMRACKDGAKAGVQQLARVVLAYQSTGLLPSPPPPTTHRPHSNSPSPRPSSPGSQSPGGSKPSPGSRRGSTTSKAQSKKQKKRRSSLPFVLTEASVVQSFEHGNDRVVGDILEAVDQQVAIVKEMLSVVTQMGGADGEDAVPFAGGGGGARSKADRHSIKHRVKKLGNGTASELLVTDQEDSDMDLVRVLTKGKAEEQVNKAVDEQRKAQDKASRRHEANVLAGGDLGAAGGAGRGSGGGEEDTMAGGDSEDGSGGGGGGGKSGSGGGKGAESAVVGAGGGRAEDKATVKGFLSDALLSKGSLDMQRRANQLGRNKQGSTAPKGLALDDVLQEAAPEAVTAGGGAMAGGKGGGGSAAANAGAVGGGSGRRGAQKTGARSKGAGGGPAAAAAAAAVNSTVVDRNALKESAAGMVRRKEAEERRLVRMKEAEEKRLIEAQNN